MINPCLVLAKRLADLGGPDVRGRWELTRNRVTQHVADTIVRPDALEMLLEWVAQRAWIYMEHDNRGWVVTTTPDDPPHDVNGDVGTTPTEAVLKAAVWLMEMKDEARHTQRKTKRGVVA